MTTDRSPWLRVIKLDVAGFNPVPYRTHDGLTILYRKKTGTWARRYDPNLNHPLGTEYQICPAVEDLRPCSGTAPALFTGACYSQTTRQTALILHVRDHHVAQLFRPTQITLQTSKLHHSKRPEKNWLLWSPLPGHLRAVYMVQPYALAEPGLDPNSWTLTYKRNWYAPKWTEPLANHLRGSTPPITLASGALLIFWHIRDYGGGYWTGASILNPDWPHQPLSATARPLLTPADATGVSPHWPPNTCIFPMFAELASSGLLTLWSGNSDRSSVCHQGPIENLLHTMEPIR